MPKGSITSVREVLEVLYLNLEKAKSQDAAGIDPFQRMARHVGIARGFGIFDDRDPAQPLCP